MTKSTITRERIQRIIRAIDSEAYDEEEIREWLSSDELMELYRMALAAMDSEPVELPLDYLQGHKDGLEWAAQLAEANHPEKGDWLYDDPIELAKAIRKGPDMQPAQPVADSEPVGSISIDRLLQLLYQFDGANECAASIGDQEYALECGDVASALRELLSCRSALPVADVVAWSNPNEERKCDIRWRRHDVEPGPLYRHAQPAVVSEKIIDNFEEEFRRAFEVSAAVEQLIEIGYQGDKFSLSIRDAATWWKLGRAAMLSGGKS